MSYFLTTLGAGTGPGTVVKCTVPTAKLNGRPIVTVGSIATHPYGTDTVIEGLPGILLNGQPVAFSTAKTALGGCLLPNTSAKISFAAPQPPSYIGFIAAPRVEKLVNTVMQVIKSVKQAAKALKNEPLPQPSSTVKLTSNYALQQLALAAQNHNKLMFTNRMMYIFDTDIAAAAAEQLHAGLLAGSVQPPQIIVCANPVHGTTACYHKTTQTIYVCESEVRAAATDNAVRHRLLVALVEEFGHHIDYLLRFVYDKNANDDADGDEGARYAYQGAYCEYAINPLEGSETPFATAEIDGETFELAYQYAELHNALKKYTEHRQYGTNDHIAPDTEGFYLEDQSTHKSPGLPNGGFGHENIQREAVQQSVKDIDIERYTDLLYKGNWMRDYSQLIAPMVVDTMCNPETIQKAEDAALKVLTEFSEVVENYSMVKKHIDGQWLAKARKKAAQMVESGAQGARNVQNKYLQPDDCIAYMSDLVGILALKKYATDGKYFISKKRYTEWRKVVDGIIPGFYAELGVSAPWDHFDNPYGLDDYSATHKKFHSSVNSTNNTSATKINKKLGLKNHIRGENINLNNITIVYNYLHNKLVNIGRNMMPVSTSAPQNKSYCPNYDMYLNLLNFTAGRWFEDRQLVKLGGALHILQDYYAHSNYPEIYMAKSLFDGVITFTDCDRMLEHCNKGYAMDGANNWADFAFDKASRESLLYTKKMHELGGDIIDNQTHARKYYRKALYAPVTTGTYDKIDLVYTALSMMNEKMLEQEYFSLDKSHEYKVKEGELTVDDVLILESLAFFEKMVGGGSLYQDMYWAFLSMRDYYVSDKAMIGSWSWRGVIEGISDFFDFKIELLERIKNTIALVRNYIVFTFIRLIVTALAELLPEIGTGLSDMLNGNYPVNKNGISNNPSHTFLAKDSAEHPVNNVAGKMAIKASVRILDRIEYIKQGDDMDLTKLTTEISDLINHPFATTLFDADIKTWTKDTPESVLRAGLRCYSLEIFTQALKWCEKAKTVLGRAKFKSGEKTFVSELDIMSLIEECTVKLNRVTGGIRNCLSSAAQTYEEKGMAADLKTVLQFYKKVVCAKQPEKLSEADITQRWNDVMQPYLNKLKQKKITQLPQIYLVYIDNPLIKNLKTKRKVVTQK